MFLEILLKQLWWFFLERLVKVHRALVDTFHFSGKFLFWKLIEGLPLFLNQACASWACSTTEAMKYKIFFHQNPLEDLQLYFVSTQNLLMERRVQLSACNCPLVHNVHLALVLILHVIILKLIVYVATSTRMQYCLLVIIMVGLYPLLLTHASIPFRWTGYCFLVIKEHHCYHQENETITSQI